MENNDLNRTQYATHKFTNSQVFVRVIKKTNLNGENLAHVRREIEILKSSNHPNIIKLLDIYENSANIYLGVSFYSLID